MNNAIMLIGRPHSSKTVFLTQFYSRLQKGKSKLSLYKPVTNITPISAAREALANGNEPEPTPPEMSTEFLLPIQIAEKRIDLLCPEYGGEQVDSIVNNREVGQSWNNALALSNNWILFIRLNSVNKPMDISDVTYTKQKEQSEEKTMLEPEYKISDQSFFIELLQILLQYKKYDYHFQNQILKLTVVLTCWDEMNTQKRPDEMLKTRLPLFNDFIKANWKAESLKIIGLSAQEFALTKEENKEKYRIEGPEQFGYLVQADGIQTKDITQLLELALS